jgi:hypothetical protein
MSPLTVVSSTAVPRASQPSRFRAETSKERSTDTAFEATGTVKWFNTERGHGFITPDGDNRDVSLHVSALERVWADGPQRRAARRRRCRRGAKRAGSRQGAFGLDRTIISAVVPSCL